MKWLYDENIVSTLFLALIPAMPAAAIVGGLIQYFLTRGLSRPARVLWVTFALLGPLNYGLWRLYNVIEDYWGLDRVEPLLINAGIMIAVGVIIGLVLRCLLRPSRTESQAPSSDTEKP
jgi:hypothetical protein